ncbi:MAG: chitobiase/beta-hexosaminidase C-terminal domain-containing protein [Bacteroidetes bacterium]|nr:chitobiase/beta-hexosaminidase C-terminal domain-containing protein [Bacteroidota bacterium]
MKYKGDSTINIYWSAGSSIQSVDLQFSDDGGVNWQQLASNVLATDESFTWTVPNIYSTRSFIKVIDHNDTTHQSRNLLSFSILPNGDTTQLPLYSRLSGFYQTPIDVNISAPSGSVIYYTLDGSDPTDHSLVYTSPIHFDEDSIPVGQPELNITASDFPHPPYSYIRSAPITLNGPMHNFYRIPNTTLLKAGVLRSRIYTPGQGLGNIVTSTYFIDSEIEEKFNVPVISLVTDPENLFNFYTGIYIPGATFNGNAFTGNYEMSGFKSERPANFEF